MVEAIRKGMFDPDLPRAERIAQATGTIFDARTIAEKSQVELQTEMRLSAEELRCAAEMAGSDGEDAEAVGEVPIALPGERLVHDRQPFPKVAPSCCVKHRLSSIVHMIAEVDFVVSSPPWTDLGLCKGPCSLLILPTWRLHLFLLNSIRFFFRPSPLRLSPVSAQFDSNEHELRPGESQAGEGRKKKKIAEVDKLACGRRITCNMLPLGDSFGDPGQMEFCEQCRAVSSLQMDPMSSERKRD